MISLLIHSANALWLVLVLVGVPAITSLNVGQLQLSATPEFRMLTLGGLGMGAVANLLGGWFSRGKPRSLCWKWALGHVAWLVVHYLVFDGKIHFRWLKDSLLWLKKSIS